MVHVLTLVAALVVAAGEVIQQRTAAMAPPEDNLSPRLLLWLVRRPRWLAGLCCSLVGNSAFAMALGMGSVVLVEAVFVSRLLFGLVIAAFWGWRRVPVRDAVGGAVVVLGIVTFLVVAQPRTPDAGSVHVNWWLGAGSPLVVSAVLAVVASRLAGAFRATLLGAGAGILFGLQAVLVQSAVHLLADGGLTGLVRTWNGYAVVVVALFGMLLVQSAFESAPLRSSYPAVVTGQLLCAFSLGVWVLHGSVRATVPWLYGLLPALLVMIGGIVLLTRSPLVTGPHRRAMQE